METEDVEKCVKCDSPLYMGQDVGFFYGVPKLGLYRNHSNKEWNARYTGSPFVLNNWNLPKPVQSAMQGFLCAECYQQFLQWTGN